MFSKGQGGKMAKIDMSSFMEENYKVEDFTHLHWKGSFQEYLDIVSKDPKITRNAFQRVHDMILSHGTSTYTEYKRNYSLSLFLMTHLIMVQMPFLALMFI